MPSRKILTPQDQRVCDGCGYERPLSGVAHIKRGWVAAFLCRDCANPDELARLEELSRERERKRSAHRT